MPVAIYDHLFVFLISELARHVVEQLVHRKAPRNHLLLKDVVDDDLQIGAGWPPGRGVRVEIRPMAYAQIYRGCLAEQQGARKLPKPGVRHAPLRPGGQPAIWSRHRLTSFSRR